MNLLKQQGIGLCLVIGMLVGGYNTIYAQDIAKANSRQTPVTRQNDIRELTIGDKVPDIEITNLVNYPTNTAKISDFKGKLVILDFWSTWCTACLASFPKMQNLQKEFNSDLQVLLVNSDLGEDEKKVKSIFDKIKSRIGGPVELPYGLHQSLLNEYFPHKYVPHYVWIDRNGIIIAITSLDHVTAQNIKKAIAGETVGLPLKKDLLDFDRDRPLLVNGNGATEDHYEYRSIITKFIDGIGGCSGLKQNAEGKITRFYSINLPLISLYQQTLPDSMTYNNRIIIDIKNSWFIQFSDETKEKTLWCYELTVPPSTREQIREYMKNDLERYFHVRVKTEKRIVKCLILYNSKKLQNTYSKSKNSDIDLDPYRGGKRFIHNQPISRIVRILNSYLNMPLLDETGLSTNIDVEFTDLNSESIILALRQAGFIVVEEEREIEIALITKN